MWLIIHALQRSGPLGTRNAISQVAMRLAIPHWQGRVSPVLDVAGSLLLVDLDRGGETNRQSVALEEDSIKDRAKRIADLGVNALICGAISWPLELALTSAKIEVIPQTCGDVEQVVSAYLTGQLHQGSFLMPGCRGRRKRFRRGGRGAGGRMGGRFEAGPGGRCVCPQCGHKAAHVSGQPCNQQKCPKCGANMTRG